MKNNELFENIDICFLSGLFPNELENDIYENSKGSIQNAANSLQWKLVDGFESVLSNNIKIINSLYIGSFPKRYKKLIIPTNNFSHVDGAQDINVGFVNFPILKMYFRYHSLKRHIREWIDSDNNKNKAIIAYAMTWPFTHILKYAKKYNQNVITCLIVPDLPEFMNLNSQKSIFYTLLKNKENKFIKKDMKYIDNYVLLTKYMADSLGVNNYVVVEGIASEINQIEERKNENLIFAYTGSLQKKYGVKDLIDQFLLVPDENIRLHICGEGELREYILDKANSDLRIKFFGQVSLKESISIQCNADVLINPRNNKEEYVKYSFPSKNLEYLSVGKVVLVYKLDGIPEEYDQYFDYFNPNLDFPIRDKIIEIIALKKDNIIKKGEKNKNFMLTYKNKNIQCRKIITKLTSTLK